MIKELINTACAEIENFSDKLGENVYDSMQEEDNSTYDMGIDIINIFSNQCTTERDFYLADSMLMAVCGYSFKTLVERIQELDELGFEWKHCQ